MNESNTYQSGDWIVHAHYGMGQIQGMEDKGISGEEKSYYRVETKDSTFWMPVDDLDEALIRPICGPDDIRRAVDALTDEPQQMSTNYKLRQSEIHKVRLSNTPRAAARLVRDLLALRRAKGPLNQTERHALQTLKKQLAAEWAIVEGKRVERIESRIDRLLNIKQV